MVTTRSNIPKSTSKGQKMPTKKPQPPKKKPYKPVAKKPKKQVKDMSATEFTQSVLRTGKALKKHTDSKKKSTATTSKYNKGGKVAKKKNYRMMKVNDRMAGSQAVYGKTREEKRKERLERREKRMSNTSEAKGAPKKKTETPKAAPKPTKKPKRAAKTGGLTKGNPHFKAMQEKVGTTKTDYNQSQKKLSKPKTESKGSTFKDRLAERKKNLMSGKGLFGDNPNFKSMQEKVGKKKQNYNKGGTVKCGHMQYTKYDKKR